MAPATDAVLPVDEFEMPGKVEAGARRGWRGWRCPCPAACAQRHASRSAIAFAHGQVLLTLETPDISELQSAWRQAQADVKQREAALAKAEADASRVRDLLANRAIAQKEVLVAETELAVATAALEQARATQDDVARRLRLFGVNVEQREALASVRSPIGGEVVEIAVAPGRIPQRHGGAGRSRSPISRACGSWRRFPRARSPHPDRSAGHDRRRRVSRRTVRGTHRARGRRARSRDAQRAA